MQFSEDKLLDSKPSYVRKVGKRATQKTVREILDIAEKLIACTETGVLEELSVPNIFITLRGLFEL